MTQRTRDLFTEQFAARVALRQQKAKVERRLDKKVLNGLLCDLCIIKYLLLQARYAEMQREVEMRQRLDELNKREPITTFQNPEVFDVGLTFLIQ